KSRSWNGVSSPPRATRNTRQSRRRSSNKASSRRGTSRRPASSATSSARSSTSISSTPRSKSRGRSSNSWASTGASRHPWTAMCAFRRTSSLRSTWLTDCTRLYPESSRRGIGPPSLHLAPEAVEDVVVFRGHHPVDRAGHQAHEPFSPHLRFVRDLGPGRFRHEAKTQVAFHRLRVHMEAERRRRLEGRDADRRLHDAIPGLAGLLPRRAEAEWTRADRVDALNRGHPTLGAGGIGEDGEHTLRTRGDHRGSSEGHAGGQRGSR